MNYFAVLLLLLQAVQSSPADSIPSSPGVHVRLEDASWVSLPKASFSKTDAKGLDLFMQTGGYSAMYMEVACPGAKATIRLHNPRPTFYVRGAGASGDVLILRLTRKKGSRNFKKSSADVTVQNKEGFRREDIRKAAVTKFPDGTFSIQPETGLTAGEYLLVLGNTSSSFDFGIDKKKQRKAG